MLDYAYSLPERTPSAILASQGHPGYSDRFASLVLRFASRNGNLFESVRMAYRTERREREVPSTHH